MGGIRLPAGDQAASASQLSLANAVAAQSAVGGLVARLLPCRGRGEVGQPSTKAAVWAACTSVSASLRRMSRSSQCRRATIVSA